MIAETVASFNITIIDNEEPPLESDETFRINFLPPVVQPVFATVTIRDVCTRQCQNGGTLDSNVCNCTCPPLYTGLSCESELLTFFITKVTACSDMHTHCHKDSLLRIGMIKKWASIEQLNVTVASEQSCHWMFWPRRPSSIGEQFCC